MLCEAFAAPASKSYGSEIQDGSNRTRRVPDVRRSPAGSAVPAGQLDEGGHHVGGARLGRDHGLQASGVLPERRLGQQLFQAVALPGRREFVRRQEQARAQIASRRARYTLSHIPAITSCGTPYAAAVDQVPAPPWWIAAEQSGSSACSGTKSTTRVFVRQPRHLGALRRVERRDDLDVQVGNRLEHLVQRHRIRMVGVSER